MEHGISCVAVRYAAEWAESKDAIVLNVLVSTTYFDSNSDLYSKEGSDKWDAIRFHFAFKALHKSSEEKHTIDDKRNPRK